MDALSRRTGFDQLANDAFGRPDLEVRAAHRGGDRRQRNVIRMFMRDEDGVRTVKNGEIGERSGIDHKDATVLLESDARVTPRADRGVRHDAPFTGPTTGRGGVEFARGTTTVCIGARVLEG